MPTFVLCVPARNFSTIPSVFFNVKCFAQILTECPTLSELDKFIIDKTFKFVDYNFQHLLNSTMNQLQK